MTTITDRVAVPRAVGGVQRRGAAAVLLRACGVVLQWCAAAAAVLLRRVDVLLAIGGAACVVVAAFTVAPALGWLAAGAACWFTEWRLDTSDRE